MTKSELIDIYGLEWVDYLEYLEAFNEYSSEGENR